MAEGVTIPFEGQNQGLKDSLIEIRDLLIQVKDGSKSAQQGLQQGAAQSVAQQERLNGALQNTVGVIAQLGKQSRGAATGKISEDLDKATDSADKFSKAAGRAAELMAKEAQAVRQLAEASKSAAAEEAKAGQERQKTVNDLDALIRKRQDLGEAISRNKKDVKELQQRLNEERDAGIVPLQIYVDALAKSEAKLKSLQDLLPQYAAKKRELEKADKAAALAEVAATEASRKAEVALIAQKKVVDDLTKSNKALEQSVKDVVAAAPKPSSGFSIPRAPAGITPAAQQAPLAALKDEAEFFVTIEKNAQDATEATDKFSAAQLSATGNVDGLNKKLVEAVKANQDQAKSATVSGQKTAESFEQGARNLQTMRQRAFDLLGTVKGIAPEQKAVLSEVIKTSRSYEQLRDIAGQLEVQQGAVNEKVKSLRQQLFDARNEALLAKQTFGEFSPEFDAATQRAGKLTNEIENLNKRIQAFNPGQRFAAFGQVLQSVAGAGTAVQGVLGLIGDQSEDVQRTLLKVQSALAITQGLNAFFGGFSDGLKSIRALLLGVTKAQVASTVATRADVGAKVASTAATTGAATATTGLTTSFRAFTASLLTNPIFLAAAAIAVIGAAMLGAADDTDELIKKMDKLHERLQRALGLTDEAIAFRAALRGIESDKALAAAGDDLGKQAEIAKQATQDEIAFLKERAQARRDAQKAETELLQLAIQAGVTDREEVKKRLAAIRDLADEAEGFERDAVVAGEQGQANAERLAADRLKLERGNAKERKQIREQLAKDLKDIERQISDLGKQKEIEQADPMERVHLEKQAADEQVALLETTLKRRIALIQLEKTLTAEAFKELTEIEKEARADALIAAGQVGLSPEQQQELNNIRLAIENKFFDALGELFEERAKDRIALIADTGERENAQFEADLEERAEVLRKAGATELEILEFQRRERAAFAQKEKLEAIDIEKQIGLAKIDAQERTAETEKQFQKRLELEKLAFTEAILQARLASITDDGTKETAGIIAQINAQIAGIRNARRSLLEQAEPVDIFKLLGFDFSPEQQAAVVQGLNQVIGLIEQVQNIAAQEVQQSISATDQIIADRERRLDDLRDRLDQELQLNEQGFASNVDLIRAQIAEEERAAEADKARRIALLNEQKRIARQQLAIDAVVQASQLAVAAAKVFGTESIKGVPGIIAAIGVIASMIAAFLSFKAKAKAIATEGVQLKKGGILKGPRHSQGGIKIPGTDQEVEGGEFVVNRRNTVRYRDLIEAINDGDPAAIRKEVAPWVDQTITRHLRVEHIVENDFAKAQQQSVEELLASVGIGLDMGATQNFIDNRKEITQHTTVNNEMSTRALERRVERATDEIRGLREDMASVEVQHDPSGRTERFNHTTRRVRR